MRVKRIEELRLLTNQLAANHTEIQQLAERARDAKISSERVLDELNARVTRVKEGVGQIVRRLTDVGMDISSTTETDQCALFIAQLSHNLALIDVARVDEDPVTAALEHVIDALWQVTLCHSWLLDTTALITCSSSFSEPCWNAFIAAVHVSSSMNDTRDIAEIFDTWFQPPQSYLYYSCWHAQWRSVFDTLTAVTLNAILPPNIDISIGTAISGSRDQCAYYASTRQLMRHEFDFDTFELRVTQVTANLSVPLYNVLSVDGTAFIALIR